MHSIEKNRSVDGSTKYLWQLDDGLTVESIRFSFQEQEFTCISSQVGCNVGCPFCATGKQRSLRNMTAQEMYMQVALALEEERAAGGRQKLDQVALAGMGEPLLNYEQVITAASLLRRDGLTDTVSVSTSGIVPRIYDLATTAETAVNKLFISLHATTEEIRNRLVPTNKKYTIPTVLEAARYYYERVGVKVTATYLVFKNINDTDEDLMRLITLLDPRIFIIQLSEWNSIADTRFEPSPRIDFFYERLTQEGFDIFVQRSKGRDIAGGCGQLQSRHIQVLSAQ
jgi:23S rRNA (adenine2503-C2)-methyltransferase